LENGEKVTLGFLGGSITAGAGASDISVTSYRALVTQWFSEQYPNTSLESINAGVGGTGSQYGAFRAYYDVGMADLVFVEFAVNDGAATPSSQSDFMNYTEGIVRRLYLNNPDVGIIFVDLARDFTAKQYAAGIIPTIVEIHQNIANHYTISGQNEVLYVNPGKDMVDYINSGQATWTGGSNPLTIDGVHPNDTGYNFIADRIIATLEQSRSLSSPLPSFAQLPVPLSSAPVDNGQLIDTSVGVWLPTDWAYKAPSDYPLAFASQLSATQVGATLEYTFTGQYIGLSVIQMVGGGSYEAWVDNGPVKTYSLNAPFTRRDMILISGNETEGIHTLYVRVTALPVTIMAFAINP
jgi:lysophospholipase L1-like esterase